MYTPQIVFHVSGWNAICSNSRYRGGSLGTVLSEQGMMAGQIADKFNDEIEQFGITAFASNKVELLNIANGRIQFDLFGKNLWQNLLI